MGSREMSQAERDFWLAEHAPRIMDTTAGLAHATLAVLKPADKERQRATIERAKEIGERFATLSVTLQTFMMDLRDDMTEAQLRAWAADLKRAVAQ